LSTSIQCEFFGDVKICYKNNIIKTFSYFSIKYLFFINIKYLLCIFRQLYLRIYERHMFLRLKIQYDINYFDRDTHANRSSSKCVLTTRFQRRKPHNPDNQPKHIAFRPLTSPTVCHSLTQRPRFSPRAHLSPVIILSITCLLPLQRGVYAAALAARVDTWACDTHTREDRARFRGKRDTGCS